MSAVRFNAEDFAGHGQMVVRCSYDGEDHQFGASVAYKVGYDAASQRTCMVSLADGLVLWYDTLDQLCDKLNRDKRGYRWLTNEEIVSIVLSVGNRCAA